MPDVSTGRRQALLAAHESTARRSRLIVDHAPRIVLRDSGPRPSCYRRREYQRTEQEFLHGKSSSLDRARFSAGGIRLPAEFSVVMGISDASSPDPSHRGHALLIAGVIAGRRAARFGVDRTPRIIVAVVGTEKRAMQPSTNGTIVSRMSTSGPPPCKTPLRNSIVPAWNSPMQNKIAGDLLILHFGDEGALFYENATHYRMRRESFSPCADQRLHVLRW
jgi:hypothetical protein